MSLTKVAFNFDERSLEALEEIRRGFDSPTLGDAVGKSLQIYGTVIDQYLKGYTELVVRNPKTGEERTFLPDAIIWG